MQFFSVPEVDKTCYYTIFLTQRNAEINIYSRVWFCLFFSYLKNLSHERIIIFSLIQLYVFCFVSWSAQNTLFSPGTHGQILQIPHCKDTMTKIWHKYFQKRNCAASVSMSSFMCLSAIYIFPGSVCPLCCREIYGPILGIYKSLTDIWLWKLDWDWGRAIPFWEYRNGIFVAVHPTSAPSLSQFPGHTWYLSLWLKD